MIYVLGMRERYDTRFHGSQNGTQCKTYALIISGIFHSVILGCAWPCIIVWIWNVLQRFMCWRPRQTPVQQCSEEGFWKMTGLWRLWYGLIHLRVHNWMDYWEVVEKHKRWGQVKEVGHWRHVWERHIFFPTPSLFSLSAIMWWAVLLHHILLSHHKPTAMGPSNCRPK